MIGALFPLSRARLELDRTLRCRSFVARALSGFLQPEEYHALIRHALALLQESQVDDALVAAAQLDLDHTLTAPTGPVRVAKLYGRAVGRSPRRARLAGLVANALLGTSWVDDAHQALEARYGPATRFLSLLGQTGRAALIQISRERPPSSELHALTELTRGAVLGLITHLEDAHPAPLCQAFELRGVVS
ncbi:MAG: hypothetical protein AB7N76_24720 [Planctomycetota bacterium]